MPHCFIAVCQTLKKVFLYTCLDTISHLPKDTEIGGKFNLPKEGWGDVGVLANEMAKKYQFELVKYDQFYIAKKYPNYEQFIF